MNAAVKDFIVLDESCLNVVAEHAESLGLDAADVAKFVDFLSLLGAVHKLRKSPTDVIVQDIPNELSMQELVPALCESFYVWRTFPASMDVKLQIRELLRLGSDESRINRCRENEWPVYWKSGEPVSTWVGTLIRRAADRCFGEQFARALVAATLQGIIGQHIDCVPDPPSGSATVKLPSTHFYVSLFPDWNDCVSMKQDADYGRRVYALVPMDQVTRADGISQCIGRGSIAVESIENFVGSYVERSAGFLDANIGNKLTDLIRIYNRLVEQIGWYDKCKLVVSMRNDV